MPHLRLEYSTNIKESQEFSNLFSLCHDVLVNTIDADLQQCQSRTFPCDGFFIGEGITKNGFIYLEVLVLDGRTPEKLQNMGNQLQAVLEKHFALSLDELNMQIAVRVSEFPRSHYFKTISKNSHQN